MDNVSIIAEDMKAMVAFFVDVGMQVEGETTVEGPWVSQVIGLEDVKSDIVMLVTPDGHNRIELSSFHRPAMIRSQPQSPEPNTLGINRIMFNVTGIDDMVALLVEKHGAKLVREIAQYEDVYRLCYLRGPEGILVALAENLK